MSGQGGYKKVVIELAGERVEGSFVLVQGAATAAQIAAMATTDGPPAWISGAPPPPTPTNLRTWLARAHSLSATWPAGIGEVDVTSLNSVNKPGFITAQFSYLVTQTVQKTPASQRSHPALHGGFLCMVYLGVRLTHSSRSAPGAMLSDPQSQSTQLV